MSIVICDRVFICLYCLLSFAVGFDEGSVTIWIMSKPSAEGKAWRVK